MQGTDSKLTRIPVKLHRKVSLVYTEDHVLAEEVLSRKKLAQDIVGRLTEQVLLVRPGRVQAVIEELRAMGHTPRVTDARSGPDEVAVDNGDLEA